MLVPAYAMSPSNKLLHRQARTLLPYVRHTQENVLERTKVHLAHFPWLHAELLMVSICSFYDGTLLTKFKVLSQLMASDIIASSFAPNTQYHPNFFEISMALMSGRSIISVEETNWTKYLTILAVFSYSSQPLNCLSSRYEQ